ncbi:MAG: hypothetical protein D6826_04810, partial [Alphaproteobacteria bacterium]
PPQVLGYAWPALQEAIEALRHGTATAGHAGDPGMAVGSVPDAIPRIGAHLSAGILFFLSALSGGDLGRWLGGRTLDALRNAGRGQLVDRLNADFSHLARLADGAGGDWRLLAIPLWDGHAVQQVRLFLRRRDKKRDGHDGKNADATRFLLEVEMSRLGEMQLDGLVRARRFDLILRTRQPLPAAMREDIRTIFQDANDGVGNAGTITFHVSRDWRLMPVPDIAPADHGGLTV